jgi:DNA-binding NarL/FixJ family response regulator
VTTFESHARPSVLLRVLVADFGMIVNDSLTALLSEFEGISVFGCVQESAKLLALAQAVHPDIAILDLQKAKPLDLTTIERLKSLLPSLIVIVLSDYDIPAMKQAAVASGADYFLLRTDCEGLLALLERLIREKK